MTDTQAITPTDVPEAGFNKLLVRAIDETVTDLLGPTVVKALHEHLRKFHDITDDEIPYKLPVVHSALKKAFARSGNTIEKFVAKKLYCYLDLQFVEEPNGSLPTYVEKAKVMLQNSSSNSHRNQMV